MSSLTAVLSLLSVLATSYGLSCIKCMSDTLSCSGDSVTCPAGNVCGSAYTESKIGGNTEARLVRTCTPSNECNLNGSISIRQGNIWLVSSCCSTDDCTPNLPALPPISDIPNHLICRYCVSASSTWCYTSDTIQCTGDENRCLLQTTSISGTISAKMAIRGCATKSICDFGSQSFNVDGLSLEAKFICTDGGMSVQEVVLTPVIVCLLLLKVF